MKRDNDCHFFVGFCQGRDEWITEDKENDAKYKDMSTIDFAQVLHDDLITQGEFYVQKMQEKAPSVHDDGFCHSTDEEDATTAIFYDKKEAKKVAKFLHEMGRDLDYSNFSDASSDLLKIVKYELYNIINIGPDRPKIQTDISTLDRIIISVPKTKYDDATGKLVPENKALIKELRKLYGEE